jgi:hypothetical protein
VEELVEAVGVFPDHLEVAVTGAPPLNVLYPGGRTEGVGFCWCRRGDLHEPRLEAVSLVRSVTGPLQPWMARIRAAAP